MKYITYVVGIFTLVMTGCTPSVVQNNIGPQGHIATLEGTYQHTVKYTSPGKTHTIVLEPHEQEIQFFDNGSITTLWSYADATEPLIVRAQKGDRLMVQVENQLPQDTSVHWHGIRVPNDQDGVPGVTQDPILPGDNYTYTIPLQDAGTFLFHPHINTVEQMARGLYGILIVEPDTYPFTYDQELIRALKDYRIHQDGSLNEQFDGMMDFTHGGRLGNLLTINNTVQPSYTIPVGSTILLRLINPSNARIYNLDLSQRHATIVGTDGGLIAEPYTAGLIQLSPGERVDVLVTMGEAALSLIDSYFPNNPYQLATLIPDMGGGEKVSTSTLQPDMFPEIPDRSVLKDQEPDEIIHLGGIGVMGGDHGMMPGGTRGRTINDGVRPESHQVLRWEQGKLRIVRLQNDSRRDHPMHLHGDFFQILGINGKDVPWHGWKDTINVPAQGYVDLAIIPTNPGTWMFHCHIIEHAHFGMMTTVVIE